MVRRARIVQGPLRRKIPVDRDAFAVKFAGAVTGECIGRKKALNMRTIFTLWNVRIAMRLLKAMRIKAGSIAVMGITF